VYDPAQQAAVVAGPAPDALAAVELAYDASADTVTAVASVSYRGSIGADFTALTVTDEYVVSGQKVYRVDGGEWPEGEGLIQVVATRGYGTGAEPAPIRGLVKDLVNFQYRAGRKLFLESGGSPDVSQVPGWDRVIAMYRAPNYA
jgi:hypothetical protein